MGFNDINEADDINDVTNNYNYEDDRDTILNDPIKSIELISKISSIQKNTFYKDFQILNRTLNTSFMNSFSSIRLGGEIKLYNELLNISDKISKSNRMISLQNKTVIGIGGKFSSGKSRFINSIMNLYILPEAQVPTTSIPTYIINGKEQEIKAFTKNNTEIILTKEELEALTHKFYKKYKIGFRYIIDNILISSSSFPYKNVAILDTPGYSKDDSNINSNKIADAEQAREQLRGSDFIIWLMKIKDGVIDNKDVEFIKTLNYKNDILFIFNKCDEAYPNPNNAKAMYDSIDKTKIILKENKIKFYDVIPYSSKEYYNTKYDKEAKLLKFLDDAESYQNKNEDIMRNIYNIVTTINKKMDNMLTDYFKMKDMISKNIYISEEPLYIKALTALYFDISNYISNIKLSKYKFKDVSNKIYTSFSNIVKKG
ncbi:dynamin family protein [Brachyspira pilosicoli]|uniref:Dynamin N-terminal domain-containing protein n=1 Tax=Brachyspira pilosicoli TaxID=52584 RepID=A0A5C8F3S7_BRAPL|nr:dynamin family protein [Brachyspira pilosicoli]TXJ44947.1 hypothetical protein EPJ72_03120 [Brachyspira pilosicoli]